MSEDVKKFALSVLDDDWGISTDAWAKLNDLLHGLGEFEFLVHLGESVDAVDGRFFLK